jgi:hypothetical protein
MTLFGAVIPGVSRPSLNFVSRALRGFVAYLTPARGAVMRDGRAVWPSIFPAPRRLHPIWGAFSMTSYSIRKTMAVSAAFAAFFS